MLRWTGFGIAAAAALLLAPQARANEYEKDKASAEHKADSAGKEMKQEGREAKAEMKEEGREVRSSMDKAGDKSERKAGTAGASADSSKRVSQHDNTDVIKKLWTANWLEIETAKMAKDKSQSEDVKQYADRLEKDHSQLGDKLKELAKNRNADLKDDDAKQQHQAHLDKMKAMDAAAFDTHFKEMMISDHDKMLNDVKSAHDQAKQSGDHELAQVLDSAKTKIQEHHQTAQNLGTGKGDQQRAGRRGATERGSDQPQQQSSPKY